MATSNQFRTLFFSSSLAIAALYGCSDGDDNTPGDSDGGSSGSSTQGGKTGTSGTNAGGVDDGGKAGKTSTGGSSTAGKGGSENGGSQSGGSNNGGSPTDDGGEPGTMGGAGGDGGEGGEGGGIIGPHIEPVLEYVFDEATGLLAHDSSGSGLDGILPLAAWSAQGRNGSALSLGGGLPPLTFVTVPPGAFKNSSALTIGAWVKLGADVPWSRIFDFGGLGVDLATRFMYLTPASNKGVLFSFFGGSAEREAVVSTGTWLPLNTWKHVAVTMAPNGDQTIYIDGFPAAKHGGIAIPPSELEPLAALSWIGKSRFALDGGLNGLVDEFQVYDRVLTAPEIAVMSDPKGDYTRITFDEGTGVVSLDTSDRAVNATLTSGVTWATGRLGAAAVLSGDAQYVTLDSNPLDGCTTEATIALWVRQTAANNWARIFDFGGTSDNFMYLVPNTHEGHLHFSIFTAAKESIIDTPTTIPADDTWHHVAVTISTAAATVFIDGAPVGNVANPVTPAGLGATNEHWLGKSRFNVDPYFKGAVDELRVACRAFTPDEIKNLAFH